jgi:glycosyltransferase involved in cell wall biosynthesis
MNMSPELTIVISAKNEEISLPRLLASLVSQDYALMPETKVVVVDAGSTDRTVEIASGFSHWLNLLVISALHSGARNAGARLAHSRYVLFLDADIELADVGLVRRAVELMKNKSLQCVTTDIFCPGGSFADRMLYAFNNLAQRVSRFHKPFSNGMFMLVDKQRFEELGGFDESALFEENYQFTRQIARSRFATLRGGIKASNRRFRTLGHRATVRLFVTAALRSRNPSRFRNESDRVYGQTY